MSALRRVTAAPRGGADDARRPARLHGGALLILAVAAVCVGVQAWFAVRWRGNFNADEAVFALMTRHMLRGVRPIFMYGQQYLGSLESVVGAGFSKVFGEGVVQFRLGALVPFALFCVLHGLVVRRAFGIKVAVVSLGLLAFPGIGILINTFRPVGAFGALVASGAGLLALVDARPGPRRAAAIGVVAGIALWSHPMSLIYAGAVAGVAFLGSEEWRTLRDRLARLRLPTDRVLVAVLLVLGVVFAFAAFGSGCRLAPLRPASRVSAAVLVLVGAGTGVAAWWVCRRRAELVRAGLPLGLGLAIGYAPVWLSVLRGGAGPSSALVPTCPTSVPRRVALAAGDLIPSAWGLGSLREASAAGAGWTVLWGAGAAVALVGVGTFLVAHRRAVASLMALRPLEARDRPAALWIVLLGAPIVLAVLSSNTVDSASVRYLIVFWQASSVALAWAWTRVRWASVAAALLAIWIGLAGLRNAVQANREWSVPWPSNSVEAVRDISAFLGEHGAGGGYTDYWLSYTFDFLTAERFPLTPYNGLVRYRPYDERVSSMAVVAYVLPPGQVPSGGRAPDVLEQVFSLTPPPGRGSFPPDEIERRRSHIRRIREKRVVDRRTIAGLDVWVLCGPCPRQAGESPAPERA